MQVQSTKQSEIRFNIVLGHGIRDECLGQGRVRRKPACDPDEAKARDEKTVESYLT
jgi:hypothetical protein